MCGGRVQWQSHQECDLPCSPGSKTVQSHWVRWLANPLVSIQQSAGANLVQFAIVCLISRRAPVIVGTRRYVRHQQCRSGAKQRTTE